jgi:predicted nucleotide-binding protein
MWYINRGQITHSDEVRAHRDFNGWVDGIAEWLNSIAPDTGLAAEWSSLPNSLLVLGHHYDVAAWPSFRDAIRSHLLWLSKIAEEQNTKKQDSIIQNFGSDIFIVHGHDEASKQAIARFIEKLGLKAIILQERPNEGHTIIEKFEKHVANVGFAIVLMTPDDVGASAKEKDKLNTRARQNVILELGFFLGKLGRKRVCTLYKEGVEIPSDYKGVLFIPMDTNNSWQLPLAKEIKATGIQIDLNKVT